MLMGDCGSNQGDNMTADELTRIIIKNDLEGKTQEEVYRKLVSWKIIREDDVESVRQLIDTGKIMIDDDNKLVVADKIEGVVRESKTEGQFFIKYNGRNHKVVADADMVGKYVVAVPSATGVKIAKSYDSGITKAGVIEEYEGNLTFKPYGRFADRIIIDDNMENRLAQNSAVCATIYENKFVVENVFGHKDVPADLTKALIGEYKLKHEFPYEVVKESEKLPTHVLPSDYENRYDMRSIPFICIDPEGCGDRDDAVNVERVEGGYMLRVAIADVARYVDKDSAMFDEACRRGNSKYVGTEVYPMYPLELSNGICSLTEGEDRLAYVHSMFVNDDGVIKSWSLFPSVINVHCATDYKNAQNIFESQMASDSTLLQQINNLYKVTTQLYRQKKLNGMLDINIANCEFQFDENGGVRKIEKDQSFSHKAIEMAMVATDECVARFFDTSGIKCLYRVHDLKEEEKLKRLGAKLQALGYNNRLCGNNYVDYDINNEIKLNEIKRIINRAVDREEEYILSLVLREGLGRAEYTTVNQGHTGLGAVAYTHVTSPIRRLCDTKMQMLMRDMLQYRSEHHHANNLSLNIPGGQLRELRKLVLASDDLSRHSVSGDKSIDNICRLCNESEYATDMLDKRTADVLSSAYAKNYIGEILPGVVTNIKGEGVVVSTGQNFSVFVPFQKLDIGSRVEPNNTYTAVSSYIQGKSVKMGDDTRHNSIGGVGIVDSDLSTGIVTGSFIGRDVEEARMLRMAMEDNPIEL